MPSPRFRQLPAEKKQRIIDAALDELSVHGYEQSSLNRILSAAGISKGVAYYYFHDKDDLIGTILLEQLDQLFSPEVLDVQALTAPSFWPTVKAFAVQLMDATEHDARVMTASKILWNLPGGRRTEGTLGEVFQRAVGLIQSLVARGRELGVIRTDLPEDLLVAQTAALDEASDHWLATHGNGLSSPQRKVIINGIIDSWYRLLRSTPKKGPAQASPTPKPRPRQPRQRKSTE